MDQTTLLGLVGTAALLGFFHTLTGPDHYVPFVAMGRVGNWSLARTLTVAGLCGAGHVLSSVVLGALGIVAGLALARLEWVESVRGDLAAWLLLGFGLAYMVWGLRRAWRNRPHTHAHVHADGTRHQHTHTHRDEHAHPHVHTGPHGRMTPWVLFTIFVFGPCEPLIPILMYPALRLSTAGVALVSSVFALTTLGTMLALVTAGYCGAGRLAGPRLERYAHALAGASLAVCGMLMVVGL